MKFKAPKIEKEIVYTQKDLDKALCGLLDAEEKLDSYEYITKQSFLERRFFFKSKFRMDRKNYSLALEKYKKIKEWFQNKKP